MKVLVTGGAGYIGSHTVRELISNGFDIVVYDNLVSGHKDFVPTNVELIEGDLADKRKMSKLFKDNDFYAVIHFAAYAYVGESVKYPAKYFNNNIVNGLNLLDSMISNNVNNLIFSSSCSIYGIPQRMPITEDMPQNPISPYGLSKLTFEKILDAYDIAYGLKSISLRYFNAAGAMPDGSIGEWHEPETHVIPLMLQSIFDGGFNVFGDDYPTPDGSCVRDYIHVCDLAVAHVKALQYLLTNNSSERINLGSEKSISVFQLINIIESVTGMELPYSIKPRRNGDPPELVADSTKAKKLLGWNSQFDINAIIQDAWNWHRKRMNAL